MGDDPDAKHRFLAAKQQRSIAEKALLSAASVLANAIDEFNEADRALKVWRKRAPLQFWTKAPSIMDIHQYTRTGYALVRVPGGDKRPWRIKRGKGFLMSLHGQIRTFTTSETAAEAANELIDPIERSGP